MADKAVRVAVLEADFASLCALGLPLSLGVQLQQSCLKQSDAQWTARSTSGGFSVSFFWPAPEKVKIVNQPRKKKRKRRQRCKAKAQEIVATTTKKSSTSEPPKSSSSASDKLAPLTPDKAHQVNAQKFASVSCVLPSSTAKSLQDDAQDVSCVPPLSTAKDDAQEPSSMSSTEKWTRVSRKPRLRFPAHLCGSLKTPSGTDSDSEDSDGSISEECGSPTVGGFPTPVADPGPNLNPNS